MRNRNPLQGLGRLKLLSIQPFQIIRGEETPKAPQTRLNFLSPRNQSSLIPSTFQLDIDEYFENVLFGGSADFSILWPRVSSTAGGNSGAGG